MMHHRFVLSAPSILLAAALASQITGYTSSLSRGECLR